MTPLHMKQSLAAYYCTDSLLKKGYIASIVNIELVLYLFHFNEFRKNQEFSHFYVY